MPRTPEELRERPEDRGGLARGEVPPEVAIDEAVGFTKRYASAEGARLVNGILGRIQREAAVAE